MERENLSDVLAALCSWFVFAFIAMLVMYLLLNQNDSLFWAMVPLMAVIFVIKRCAEREHVSK